MMLERWLILSGADHGGREQVEARAEMLGLARVHACRSFTVLADPRVPLLIDPVAGLVIIGRLFDRANNARVSIPRSWMRPGSAWLVLFGGPISRSSEMRRQAKSESCGIRPARSRPITANGRASGRWPGTRGS
jgi:hypothetical protein